MSDPRMPDPRGGRGDEHLYEGTKRGDSRLAERAFKERWPMSDKVRAAILNRLAKIVDDDAWDEERAPSNREVVAATQALIAADRLNLEERRLELLERQAGECEEDPIDVDVIGRADAIREARRAKPPV